jgi:tetratricopeptide (TPR) repeat protein
MNIESGAFDHTYRHTLSLRPIGVHRAQGDLTQAEENYQRALKITETNLGLEHPDIILILNNLATLAYESGRLVEAESLYLRAKSVGEKLLGRANSHLATILVSLGSVYYDSGRFTESERCLHAALEIQEGSLGSEHPDVARSLKYYAVILRETGRKIEAKDVEARAQSILAKPGNRAAAHSVTVDALIFEQKRKANK